MIDVRRYYFSILVAWFTVIPAAVFGARAENWWGHKLANQPAEFLFGYGSLINAASRDTTAAKPISAIPVRVSAAFGYLRAWNDRASSGFTALGLRKPDPGEQASTINGVLYPVDGSDMGRFDAREQGYARVEIPRDDVEAVSWQRLPADGHIWVYVPVRQGHGPGEDLPEPDTGFPVLESYVDVVLEGALDYGPEFARELIETTTGWSHFWLNDRELARRPWVHDPRYEAVDRLLQEVAPASSVFADRLFTEPYIARWLTATKP
jgi:hypothetical protein